jgi:hypothetical protein
MAKKKQQRQAKVCRGIPTTVLYSAEDLRTVKMAALSVGLPKREFVRQESVKAALKIMHSALPKIRASADRKSEPSRP